MGSFAVEHCNLLIKKKGESYYLTAVLVESKRYRWQELIIVRCPACQQELWYWQGHTDTNGAGPVHSIKLKDRGAWRARLKTDLVEPGSETGFKLHASDYTLMISRDTAGVYDQVIKRAGTEEMGVINWLKGLLSQPDGFDKLRELRALQDRELEARENG